MYRRNDFVELDKKLKCNSFFTHFSGSKVIVKKNESLTHLARIFGKGIHPLHGLCPWHNIISDTCSRPSGSSTLMPVFHRCRKVRISLRRAFAVGSNKMYFTTFNLVPGNFLIIRKKTLEDAPLEFVMPGNLNIGVRMWADKAAALCWDQILTSKVFTGSLVHAACVGET
jgi:hypothetical protein